MQFVNYLFGLATTGISGTLTLTKTGSTARTFTLPDANTTITGGGTLALGGFTLTVPATGTAALLGASNVFSSTGNIFQQPLQVGVTGTTPVINLVSSSNVTAALTFTTSGVLRGSLEGDNVSLRCVANSVTVWAANAAGTSFQLNVNTILARTAGSDAQFTAQVTGTGAALFGFNNSGSTNTAGALTGGIYFGTAGSFPFYLTTNATIGLTMDTSQNITFAGTLTMSDAKNIVINTSTGTKIGTGTTQKIGFWNATPVVQPASAAQAAPAAYATGAFGLDSDANMHALYDLVVAMRTALVNTGIIKGSA